MRISFSKIVLTCVVLGGTTYGIATLRGYRFVVGADDKHHQIEQLERENEDLQRQNSAKQDRVDDLRQNPEHLKLLIEDQYKLVGPGTKSFIVQDGEQVDKPVDPAPDSRAKPSRP